MVSYGYAPSLAHHFPNDDDWHAGKKKSTLPSSTYTLNTFNLSTLEVKTRTSMLHIKSGLLPGSHNALNLTAVIALVTELYHDPADYTNLRPPYGRGEVIALGSKRFTLQLVKNPAGFHTAMSVEPRQPALIVQ
jgi:UDP-N-acetylmuramyl tripeptide synthase